MNSKILIIFLLINLVDSYFDVQLDRSDVLEQDTNYVDWSSLKVRRINKTRSIIGEMKFPIPFGNDVKLQGLAYKKQGGEYRLMPYKIQPTPFCDLCSNDSKLKEFLIIFCGIN